MANWTKHNAISFVSRFTEFSGEGKPSQLISQQRWEVAAKAALGVYGGTYPYPHIHMHHAASCTKKRGDDGPPEAKKKEISRDIEHHTDFFGFNKIYPDVRTPNAQRIAVYMFNL